MWFVEFNDININIFNNVTNHTNHNNLKNLNEYSDIILLKYKIINCIFIYKYLKKMMVIKTDQDIEKSNFMIRFSNEYLNKIETMKNVHNCVVSVFVVVH